MAMGRSNFILTGLGIAEFFLHLPTGKLLKVRLHLQHSLGLTLAIIVNWTSEKSVPIYDFDYDFALQGPKAT